jgi:hypothetical protein
MTVMDMVDGGFAVLRADPAKILLIAASVIVPLTAVEAYVARRSYGGASFLDVMQDNSSGSSSSSGADGATVLFAVLLFLALTVVIGAVARVVAAWYGGREVTAGDALGAAGRRVWALVLAWLAVVVLAAIGFVLFVLPGLLVLSMFAVAAPVIVVERTGPLRGLRRSWRLVGKRVWTVLGALLAAVLAAGIIDLAFGILAALFLSFSWGWVVGAVVNSLGRVVAGGALAGTVALIYLDLRVRREGLDLELQAADVFAPAPRAR